MKKALIATLAITCLAAFDIKDVENYEALLNDLPDVQPTDFTEEWFTANVDNFNYQDTSTYQQRYFKNDKYFDQENGPIFIYICGEYTCSVRSDRLYAFMIGAKYKAQMFALEHRFYGSSQPFTTWDTPNLGKLTAEQALADLAHFLQVQTADKPDRKILIIGGSYPGAMSAWFRQRYPQFSVASWASSAVVYPEMDMWQFDEVIYTATSKHSAECPQQIKAYSDKVEGILIAGGAERFELVVTKFGADTNIDNGDFAFFWTDIFVEGVQYGGRTRLCDLLDTIKDKTWQEQMDAIKVFGDGANPNDYDRQHLSLTAITSSASRPWTYQYCTEFGFYQIPSQIHPMRSVTLLSHDYWVDMCTAIFNTTLQINRSIAEFSFHRFSGTNTMFTNGMDDPWQVVTELNPNVKLNDKLLYASCRDCGHCGDLYTPKDSDLPELKGQRWQVYWWIQDFLGIIGDSKETQAPQLTQ